MVDLVLLESLARAAAVDVGSVEPPVVGHVDVEAWLEEARTVRDAGSSAPPPARVQVVEIEREVPGSQGEQGPPGPEGPPGKDGITPIPVFEGTALAFDVGGVLTPFVELKGDRGDGGTGFRSSNAPATSGNNYFPGGW
jgi:hypothetical protein